MIPGSALWLACVTGILALLPDRFADFLAYERRALAEGEVWRLWTAHLVHFHGWHAPIDIAALCVVAGLTERVYSVRCCWAALFLGAPLISLGLLGLVPELIDYRGSSGIAYLLGTLVGVSIWRWQRNQRRIINLIGIAVGIKLLLDALAPLSFGSALSGDIRVAWQAHLLGIALAVGALLLSRTRRQSACRE